MRLCGATRSASRRRATNPRSWAEAWSSHWASSTRQTSGRSSATSASRLSAPTPIRKRLVPWVVAMLGYAIYGVGGAAYGVVLSFFAVALLDRLEAANEARSASGTAVS